MNFTEEQNKAIFLSEGIICLSAGPGCGKTTVLINKYFYILEKLIKEKDPDIETLKEKIKSILVVTFTNKATEEIKIRLKNVLQKKYANINAEEINKILNFAKIYTIDSFASNFIKENIFYTDININSDFEIINSNSAKDLFLKIGYNILDTDEKYINIIESLNLSKSPSQILKSAFTLIENLLSRLITPDILYEKTFKSYQNKNADEISLDLAEFFKNLYINFNKSLEEKNILIFSNLLMYAYKIIKNFPNVLYKYVEKESLEYILIDEYQDVNDAEDLFLREISNAIKNYKHRKYENYFLVGDTGQSIYGFRNANYHLMLEYKSLSKSNHSLNLSQNFRSNKNIIAFINQYFLSENNNIYQNLLAMKEEIGEKVEIFLASSYSQDAEYIAKTIKYLILEKNYSPKDIKILFRSKNKIPIYAKILEKFSIPYRVNDPIMFTKSLEIKIFLSIMKFLLNPMDDEANFLILKYLFNFSDNELIIIKNLDDINDFKEQIEIYLKNPENNAFFETNIKKYKYMSFFETISFLSDIDFTKLIKAKNSENNKKISNKLENEKDEFNFFENLSEKIKTYISFSTEIFKIFNQNNILDSFNKILETNELKKFINSCDINFVKDFQTLIRFYEKEDLFGNITGFLEFFKNMEEDDFRILEKDFEERDEINLLTIHKSKGLEFKIVFLAGINNIPNRQNIFHFSDKYGLIIKYNEEKEILKNGKTNFYQKFLKEILEIEHLKEEERIFYVGVTRTKEKLFISFIKQNETYPKLSNKILELQDDKYVIKNNFKSFVKIANLNEDEEFNNFNENIDKNLKIEEKINVYSNFFDENIKKSMQLYLEENKNEIFIKKEKIFFSVAELELFRKCPFLYFLEKQKNINFLNNLDNSNNSNNDENIDIGNIFHEFLFELFYKKYDKKLYEKILIEKFKIKNLKFDDKIVNNFIFWLEKQNMNNILFVEKNFAWKINDFIIRGTIDRIDKLDNNEFCIVDYKTSFNKKNFNNYILIMNIYMHAINEIFNLDIKNIKLIYPIINEEIILKKIPKDELKNTLNNYVKQIKSENFPKSKNQNCKFCLYQDFCN